MKKELELFYEILGRRKSVREFSPRELEEEKVQRILEVGRRAASAANCQPWHFILLKKENRREFDRVFYKPNFKTAPLIIAACAEPQKAWVRKNDRANFAWVDLTIAVTEMILAATAEGIGTCWIAAFELEKARRLLFLPEHLDLVTLIALGYPLTPLVKEEKYRKKMEEIIHYGKW